RGRTLRKPGYEPATRAILILPQEKARGPGYHLETDGRFAVDPDLLDLTAGGRLAGRVLHMNPRTVAVGESPRDVSVRAGAEKRRGRQSYTVQIEGRLGSSAFDTHPCAIPDRGYAGTQMHVAGDQRGSRVGQPARHRPVVAADASVPRSVLKRRRRRRLRP